MRQFYVEYRHGWNPRWLVVTPTPEGPGKVRVIRWFEQYEEGRAVALCADLNLREMTRAKEAGEQAQGIPQE